MSDDIISKILTYIEDRVNQWYDAHVIQEFDGGVSVDASYFEEVVE